MTFNKFKILFLISFLLITTGCQNPFRWTDARETPVNAKDRVQKNLDEGRGISFGLGKDAFKGGVFDFASSNELWRASIEILDFVSLTNASYSGGIIITDWFAGNKSENNNQSRELKITVRFLSNEIRADGIEVSIHERLCSQSVEKKCKIQKINSEISMEIKLAILKKAALLKKSEKKNKKKLKTKTN
mgnify:CR=1 FL=1|tara:strand:- start:195 stop:761 length:567 start_codon:yes stop_codon:yes gene_type:complete